MIEACGCLKVVLGIDKYRRIDKKIDMEKCNQKLLSTYNKTTIIDCVIVKIFLIDKSKLMIFYRYWVIDFQYYLKAKNNRQIKDRLTYLKVEFFFYKLYIVTERLATDMLEMILSRKPPRLQERNAKFVVYQVRHTV
jgi:hypothetical protein